MAMALAWILWRNVQEALQWDNEFRAQCWDWKPFEAHIPVDGGTQSKLVKGHIVDRRMLTNCMLFEMNGPVGILGCEPIMPGMTPADAKKQLWAALLDGRTVGEGLPASGGSRADIPAREWLDIENALSAGLETEYFRYRHQPLGKAYLEIVVRRAELLQIWPELPAHGLKTTPKPTRRIGRAEDEAAFVGWVEGILALGGTPPTRKDAEKWAADHNIGVTWARRQHTNLPAEKKLAPGETPTRRRSIRQETASSRG
jgi:hypothetical protein